MGRSSWKAWLVFSNFIYSVFTLTEFYLLSVLVGWWIPLRVDSKGFQLLCTHTPDLSPFHMKPCDWPLHTSHFPLDQWLHSSPTWNLCQTLPMPFLPGLKSDGCSNVWPKHTMLRRHITPSAAETSQGFRKLHNDFSDGWATSYLFMLKNALKKKHLWRDMLNVASL